MQAASVLALLQAALSLLALVQSTPNIPQSLQNTAIQTVQQAILLATSVSVPASGALVSQPEQPIPVVQTCPTYSLPACTNGTLVPQGTDTNGCQLPPICEQNSSPPTQPAPTSLNFTATPTSGPAPLAVTFSITGNDISFYALDFGNGQKFVTGTGSDLGNVNCNAAAQNTVCEATQTYTTPRSYTATLYGSNGTLLGTATITVTGGGTTQPSATPTSGPSATIDQENSTIAVTPDTHVSGYYDIPQLSGTASGTNQIRIVVRSGSYTGPGEFNSADCTQDCPSGTGTVGISVPVSNERWQTQGIIGLPTSELATRTVTVLVYDGNPSADSMPLTSAILPLQGDF